MPDHTTTGTTEELGGTTGSLDVETGSSQDPLAQTGQQTAERAGQLAERAKETGLQQANTQMSRVADTIDTAASAIRRAGSDVAGDQPAVQNVASTVAERAEQLSQYLRETDARELLRGAEDFARRQPLLVVGGAFALGLLGARFLKASSSQAGGGPDWRQARYGDFGTSRAGLGGYGTGYGTGYGAAAYGVGSGDAGTAGYGRTTGYGTDAGAASTGGYETAYDTGRSDEQGT